MNGIDPESATAYIVKYYQCILATSQIQSTYRIHFTLTNSYDNIRPKQTFPVKHH